jgi:hypothetical protein
MNVHPLVHRLLCLTVFVATAASGQMTVPDPSDSLEWRFQVYLDNKKIGWHEFKVDPAGELLTVETEARFDVKFFFITAYKYRHRNVETWDSMGLVSIDAYTNANGKEYQVRGERTEENFRVSSGDTIATLPMGLKSFCYWSPDILDESRLLNSQTGEYEQVEVIEQGVDSVSYLGELIPARQFDLMVKGQPISVWYAVDDDRWLALESLTEGGRVIRYEPVKVPVSPMDDLLLLSFAQ